MPRDASLSDSECKVFQSGGWTMQNQTNQFMNCKSNQFMTFYKSKLVFLSVEYNGEILMYK